MSALPIVLTSILLLRPLPTLTSIAPDTLVEVGGHRLHFEVREGALPITIVLEPGGGADGSSWASVPDSLASRTGATIVVYDRAGLGGSELGPTGLTPEDEVRDLRQALDELGLSAPTLIVAHSYGGMLAFLHAGLYPDQVVGLVLVDPMNAVFANETGDFLRSTVPDIDEPESDHERVIVRMRRTFSDLIARVAELEPRLEIPIVLLTAGEPWWGPEEIDRAWRWSHEVIASRSPDRELVVAEGSDHDVPKERPDLIVDAVTRVMATVDRSE